MTAPSGPPAAGQPFRTLEVRREGPVGWLVFDRPAVGNAIDATMFDELPRAWAELDADPAVRVIVNTGNGRAFQTGLDMGQLAGDPGALREQARRTRQADLGLTAWHNGVAKPVVAAVNGTCAGGGLHFVVDADVVLAAADARFLDPHVSVGQASAFEAIGLARKVPAEAVFRMALAGRFEAISARRAYEIGLVGQVVDPPHRLRAAAQAVAERIALTPPDILAAIKRSLWAALER